MRYLNILLAGFLFTCSGLGHAAVTVIGDVHTSGQFQIDSGSRLLDVTTAAQPNAEGYWLGAAWLHTPLLENQRRLKSAVLFDLKVLQRAALLDNKPNRAALAQHLYENISRLPVTGRKMAVLDPVALEVGFARNYHLHEGDSLIYPVRPNTVEVLGAVVAPCNLPYRSMQDALYYLGGCTPLSDADADYIWIIQPDGRAERIGVARWNREENHPLAAGSKILVPIKNDDLDQPTPELNEQLAEFLATQPVAEVIP